MTRRMGENADRRRAREVGAGGRALPSAAPQARHHFTQFDQIDRLVAASEADADLGFMARLIALCSLPRRNPGNQLQYVRRNGPYTLGMSAGINNKLPYGTLPRLLMAWVCFEAVRTQSPELVLGDSLAAFMRKLDLYSTSGGTTGGRTRLRNQMRLLFGCMVTLIYEDARGDSHDERRRLRVPRSFGGASASQTRARYGKARSSSARTSSTRSSATRCRST